MWQIRPARAQDEEAVLQLWRSVGLGKAEADEWRAIISGPGATLLVAEAGGALAGTAVAAFDGWRAHIYHVAVTPTQQRRGLAKALMAEAELHAYERGARRVYAMVSEDNIGGLALAAATGYEPNGDVVFVKDLSS